jgi:DNA-binding NarL/FixJ family response regulator
LALQFLIDHEPGMEVIGLAIRSEGLAAQVRALLPDVVLLDWNLVTQPEAEMLSDLRSLAPGLKIVALHVRPELKQAAESAGADVFISKDTPPDELIMFLRKMREDELASLH